MLAMETICRKDICWGNSANEIQYSYNQNSIQKLK